MTKFHVTANMSYYLQNGTEVTEDQIKDAFTAGRAVLVYGRGENHTSTSLRLDGEHFDTRGQCHSMWEEAWTASPATVREALSAARA